MIAPPTKKKAGRLPHSEYFSILSTGGKYEINESGQVRNAKTKHKLALQDNHGKCYRLFYGGKLHCVMLNQLMWEVFGRLPPEKYFKTRAIKVVLVKDGVAKSFESIKAAARYLSEKIHYSVHHTARFFSARQSEIGGYKVYYYEEKITRDDNNHGRGRRKQ